MELVKRLQADILDLVEYVQIIRDRAGERYSDTKVSKDCFGHGEFIKDLRRWDSGKGSPTLDKLHQLETFLYKLITDKQRLRFQREKGFVYGADQRKAEKLLEDFGDD